MNILIVIAHPDDETLGMGGTIAKYAKDNEICVLILTEGVTARYSREIIKKQRKDAINAGKMLGVKEMLFAGLPDQQLDTMPLIKIIEPISEIIRKIKPEIVYTHYWQDINQDHKKVFEATMIATRPFKGSSIKKVLCFETPSSTEWAFPYTFSPNVFEDISPTLETKIKAFTAYKREKKASPHPRTPESITHLARLRGAQVGLNAAEAFALVRKIQK